MKAILRSILNAWGDLFFPPFCLSCQSRSETKLFCPSCWTLCAPPDAEGRCNLCFEEAEESVCARCRQNALPFLKAHVFERFAPPLYLARERSDMVPFFALHQWAKLSWSIPDAVVPMPNAKSLALAFAKGIERPFANVLRPRRDDSWECDREVLEENQVLLLIDQESSWADLHRATQALAETSPKKGYVLSLFLHDSFHF